MRKFKTLIYARGELKGEFANIIQPPGEGFEFLPVPVPTLLAETATWRGMTENYPDLDFSEMEVREVCLHVDDGKPFFRVLISGTDDEEVVGMGSQCRGFSRAQVIGMLEELKFDMLRKAHKHIKNRKKNK